MWAGIYDDPLDTSKGFTALATSSKELTENTIVSEFFVEHDEDQTIKRLNARVMTANAKYHFHIVHKFKVLPTHESLKVVYAKFPTGEVLSDVKKQTFEFSRKGEKPVKEDIDFSEHGSETKSLLKTVLVNVGQLSKSFELISATIHETKPSDHILTLYLADTFEKSLDLQQSEVPKYQIPTTAETLIEIKLTETPLINQISDFYSGDSFVTCNYNTDGNCVANPVRNIDNSPQTLFPPVEPSENPSNVILYCRSSDVAEGKKMLELASLLKEVKTSKVKKGFVLSNYYLNMLQDEYQKVNQVNIGMGKKALCVSRVNARMYKLEAAKPKLETPSSITVIPLPKRRRMIML